MEDILTMAKKSLGLLNKQGSQLKLKKTKKDMNDTFTNNIDELNYILKITGDEIDNQNKQLKNYSFDK
jgi:hypothetical protein